MEFGMWWGPGNHPPQTQADDCQAGSISLGVYLALFSLHLETALTLEGSGSLSRDVSHQLLLMSLSQAFVLSVLFLKVY